MANKLKESRKFGWALIGCGNAGRTHLRGAQTTPNVEIIGFCDVNQVSAQRFASDIKESYHTNDPLDIFNDPKIDIISIATSHSTHADLAIGALRAGKHIWLEKPMAMTKRDCIRIKEVLDSSGKKMMINFSIRFSGAARAIKDRIKSKVSHGQCMMKPADLTQWRWDPKEGGGPLYDVGVHALDFLCWIHDAKPVEVNAVGGQVTHPDQFGESGLVDTVAATIRFNDDSVSTFLMSDAGSNPAVSKWFFEFYDGEHSVVLDEHFSRARFSNGDVVMPPPIDRLPLLIEAIQNDTEPYVSAGAGMVATELVEKIALSIHTKSPQRIEFAD